MTLVVGSNRSNDTRYSEEKVTASRNFANKLWNAARFVLMNLPEDFAPGMPAEELLDMSDKWVLSELAAMAGEVTANLEKYELALRLTRSKSSSGKFTATGISRSASPA